MAGFIKQLKSFLGVSIYPLTKVRAVSDENGKALDIILKDNFYHDNLLDNPWFTINQDDNLIYTTPVDIQTVDRWVLQGNSTTPDTATLEVMNNAIKLLLNGTNQGIRQNLELAMLENNKTYTMSIEVNGVIYKKTFINSEDNIVFEYPNANFSLALIKHSAINLYAIYPLVYFGTLPQQFIISKVKLELGNISTLHLDTSPNPQVALAKCQRYYQVIKCKDDKYWGKAGAGVCVSATQAEIIISLPVVMRITPSILHNLININDGSSHAVSAINVTRLSNNQLAFVCTSTGLTPGNACILEWRQDLGGYLKFSGAL